MRKPSDVAAMVMFPRNGSDHTNYVYYGLMGHVVRVRVTQNLLECWLQLVMKGIRSSLACKSRFGWHFAWPFLQIRKKRTKKIIKLDQVRPWPFMARV